MLSPITWVGGKSKLAKKILHHFPKKYDLYVEPFGGGGSVLLAQIVSQGCKEVYNDINGELVNFFTIARDAPEQLTELLDMTLYSRQQHRELLKEYIDSGLSFAHEDSLLRAMKFFTLNRQAFGGWVHPTNHGWSFASNDKQTWRVSSFRSAIKRIKPFAERFSMVQVESMPYEYMLEKYDSPTTLFYLDPPYSATSTRYYHKAKKGNEYYNTTWTEEDDIALAARVNNIEGKAIISYYPCELLDELYGVWHRFTYDVDSFGEEATELLLCNYKE